VKPAAAQVRRDCALLSGDLRAVDRPRRSRLRRPTAVYLYIAAL